MSVTEQGSTQLPTPRQPEQPPSAATRTPQVFRTGGETSRVIDAPPQVLYAMVADVRRMGLWSPECRACEWLDGATHAEPGARFRGHNRSGLTRWSRTCEVVTADPGREFAFRTVPDRLYRDATVWRYRFEAVDGGTRVTESYEITMAMPALLERVCARLLPQHIDMRPQMAATLDRIADAADGRPVVEQLRLPRQADAPAGPVEASGMYLFHFALRRDLDVFPRAVAATPLTDAETWSRLRDRWTRLAHLVHKHHGVEDAVLWPTLLERVAVAGDDDGRDTLTAMEAEHAEVDPLGQAVATGFDDVAADPTEARRAALQRAVEAFRDRLLAHLVHEERDAMGLVQRHFTQTEWTGVEKQFEGAYSTRDVPFALGWMQHELPADGRRCLKKAAGPFWPVVVIGGPVFDRAERRTFRYVR